MEDNLKEYDISFVGLREGLHEFQYKIGNKFFTKFTNTESVIEDGDVRVEILLEKSSRMLVLTFLIIGTVTTRCDICLDSLVVDIENEFRQICKFSDEEITGFDDEISAIPPSDYEINVARFIYEFIHLCIPAKMVHEDGECNEHVKSIVDEYILTEENPLNKENIDEENRDVDPRWAALQALKNKN